MNTKFTTITTLILMISISGFCQQYKKYPFKSGKIEYKMEGNTKGTQVLYWDDYGYKEATIDKSESKIFGQVAKTDKTTLVLGEYEYEWSQSGDDNRIFKTSNPILATWKEGEYDDDDVEEFSRQTIEQMGYEKIGTETILGHKCDIYKGMGKAWIWKGINLKSEVKVLGTKIIITATNVETNISIPSSVFKLPEGREIVAEEALYQQTGDESESENDIDINPDEVKKAIQGLFGGN